MAKKKRQIRVDFRKKYGARTRSDADLTQRYHSQPRDEIDTPNQQRVSGKGQWTRRRTVTVESNDGAASGEAVQLDVEGTISGLVLRVHGLESVVLGDDGREYRCALRGLLKSMATDQRHVVVAGDRVQFHGDGAGPHGVIMRIGPRRNELARASKEKRHVIAANVDQLLIVTSAAEPSIKPNLIDRLLITAESNRVPAVICINKCDLIDPTSLQGLIGSYSQMGYRVIMLSAARRWNTDLLRQTMRNKATVVIGQSGVGKSSLLNVIDDQLRQRVQAVSAENQKGKHTTTTAQVFPLRGGGSMIDTPGVRQFQLWNIIAEELSGLFRDIRPFASQCRYPNCTHVHEDQCAVKAAVADYRLDVRRYESYVQMRDDPQGMHAEAEIEE